MAKLIAVTRVKHDNQYFEPGDEVTGLTAEAAKALIEGDAVNVVESPKVASPAAPTRAMKSEDAKAD